MLSPYMSKTFLSILAVPNKTDFCTIPAFNLIPSVSIHPLKPLLMHPELLQPLVQPQPFSATRAFSALSSDSGIFQSFRFLYHFQGYASCAISNGPILQLCHVFSYIHAALVFTFTYYMLHSFSPFTTHSTQWIFQCLVSFILCIICS